MTKYLDLDKMDPKSFEHMVNALALSVLGSGHTGFGPGPDGGRDGYFKGEAIYPSSADRWSGTWYIQSKYYLNADSTDRHKWLLGKISEEIEQFQVQPRRRVPNIWIIATNIDPSGVPETGAFDRAKKLVADAFPQLEDRFDIWGGKKIIDLLDQNQAVADRYGHFLTPGHILAALHDQLRDHDNKIKEVTRYFVVQQFTSQKYAKLDQAGSDADVKHGVHNLFVDLPFTYNGPPKLAKLVEVLTQTSSRCHRPDPSNGLTADLRQWNIEPNRARLWLIKGGPGQGKSTATQFFSQIQRAALILQPEGHLVSNAVRETAEEIRNVADRFGIWPSSPRIPINVELREYARWAMALPPSDSKTVLAYLSSCITKDMGVHIAGDLIKRALHLQSWFVVFDGLDEVPEDAKAFTTAEVIKFADDLLLETEADALIACTSRPQGYSGQYSQLDMAILTLEALSAQEALECSLPVIRMDRTTEEIAVAVANLESAIADGTIVDLMTTPLQAHIMAVIVRDGGSPPNRRWKLFENFYLVISKREANRNLPDRKLASLLRDDDKLIRALHARLGFILHAHAERSTDAQGQLSQSDFHKIVTDVVTAMKGAGQDETIRLLEQAASQRLVLINTPDDGSFVRFDIRPLQEFFASEFLYTSVPAEELSRRLRVVAGDSHWREVMHFLLSALIERDRQTELTVAINELSALQEARNEGHRNTSRRMCIAPRLAMRLVSEGILEQDIQIRAQFKELIKGFSSNPSVDAFRLAGDIRNHKARSWVIDCLLEEIKEKTDEESVGAKIILSHIVRDSDPQADEVDSLFSTANPRYLAPVLCARSQSYAEHIDFLHGMYDDETQGNRGPWYEHIQNWTVRVCMKLLLDQRWKNCGEAGTHAALDLIHTKEWEDVKSMAAAQGYSEAEIYALLISCPIDPYSNSRGEQMEYGKATLFKYEYDWLSPDPRFTSLTDDDLHELRNSRGFFKAAAHIICFASQMSYDDLREFFMVIGALPYAVTFSVLPESLVPYIPGFKCLSEKELNNELSASTEEAIQAIVSEKRIGRRLIDAPFYSLGFGFVGNDPTAWLDLLLRYPENSLYHWRMYTESNNHGGNIIESLDLGVATAQVIADQIPELFEFPLMWGRILLLDPQNNEQLLSRLRSHAASNAPVASTRTDIIAPMQLTMPVDSVLLPAVISAVIHQADAGYTGSTFRRSLGSEWLQTTLAYVVPMTPEIVDLSTTHSSPWVRSALIIMLMVRTDVVDMPAAWEDRLVADYEAKPSRWIIKLLVASIKVWEGLGRPRPGRLVSRMADASRGDSYAADHFQVLLTRWRETSRAPVMTGGYEERWLNRD